MPPLNLKEYLEHERNFGFSYEEETKLVKKLEIFFKIIEQNNINPKEQRLIIHLKNFIELPEAVHFFEQLGRWVMNIHIHKVLDSRTSQPGQPYVEHIHIESIEIMDIKQFIEETKKNIRLSNI